MRHAKSVLLIPVSAEMKLEAGALAFAANRDRIRHLLSVIDQFPAIREINPSLRSFSIYDSDAMLSLSPRLNRNSGPFADIAARMTDREENILASSRILEELEFKPVVNMRIEVYEGFLEAKGIASDGRRWRSSALWPASLLYALLPVAPEEERAEIFERMALLDPDLAAEVLAHGVRWDYPVRTIAAPPRSVSKDALMHILERGDAKAREKAVTHLPRIRSQTRSSR